MTEKTFTPRRYLFEGLDRGFRGGDRAVLRAVNDDGRPTGDALAFAWTPKTFRGLTPGWTYVLDASDNGGGLTIKFGAPRDGQPLADDAERQAVRLRHEAAMTSLAADKAVAKAKLDDKALGDLLAPIRAHYRQMTTTQQKVAFEVALIGALRKSAGPFG